MRWGPQQSAGIKACTSWLRQCDFEIRAGRRLSQPVFRLFGFAGTGKTTLAKTLAKEARSVCYAAFTGKAALMMQRSGCYGASTIHSLIYTVDEDAPDGARFILNRESAASEAGLIVIDEVSMVGPEIGADLMSFGRPILVLGDPAQLPPVKGTGFFTEAKPDVMLTEIHRQARDNPIIDFATLVREGGTLGLGSRGDSRVVERGTLSDEEVMDASQVLVGRNNTRRAFNAKLRRLGGFESEFPEAGDRLVCLRNDKTVKILNGGLFDVVSLDHARCDKRLIGLTLTSDDFPRRGPVEVQALRQCFTGGVEDMDWRDLQGTQVFDYGYALTCHKAQGSQWPDVVIYDESRMFREDARRWLYTALTRASERVTVVLDRR